MATGVQIQEQKAESTGRKPQRHNRALILIGFAGAFRRSELCAMTVADLCFSAAGLVISVPRSKADQEQAGE